MQKHLSIACTLHTTHCTLHTTHCTQHRTHAHSTLRAANASVQGAAFLFFGILNLVLALWAGIVWATHERFNLIPPAKVMADVTSN